MNNHLTTNKLCLNCNTNQAIKIEPYGYTYCADCQDKQRQYKLPNQAIELTTSDIKDSRKEFQKDILQRWRGDTPSLEYIKEYGGKGFSREELKKARNVNEENFYVNKEERLKSV